MSAINKAPQRFFYLEWIVLNAMTVVMAEYIAWALISLIESVIGGTIQVGGQSRITEDFLFMYVFSPSIGLLTGIIQFILLRRYLPRMTGWIAATFLGWLMPFVIGFIITRLFTPGNSTVWIVLGMSLLGTMMALPQWWILRKRVRHASRWVLSFGLGWGIVG
jgi:peptidoglycan/LPS O-acetylase OafA/YrhL